MSDKQALIEFLEAKQDAELEALRSENKAMMKAAKKSNRAVVEAQSIQREYDLKAKHMQEMEDLEENDIISDTLREEYLSQQTTGPEDSCKSVDQEENAAATKKAKSKRKKDRKLAKQAEREQLKDQINSSSAPSARDIENERMNEMLTAESLKVKEIESDGHCLYRAVADQLRSISVPHATWSSDINFVELRKLTADYMRANADSFAPFVGTEGSSAEYEEYCRKVESELDAVWGGQLEINAMCSSLRLPIWIYEVGKPVLKMGEEYDSGHHLKITYHRHYYALGEHYNTVQPM